jgi:hypothetical protein
MEEVEEEEELLVSNEVEITVIQNLKNVSFTRINLIGFLFRITDRSTRHKLTEQGLVFWKSE